MSLRVTLLSLILIPLVFAGLEFSWRAIQTQSHTFDTTLSTRTVIGHEVFGGVVRYTYLGEPLPDTLAPEEVVGMRTETSYSRLVTLDDETATVETISFPQKTFTQDLYGVWYYAEYATTTIEMFEARSALYHVRRGLARIFLPVVYAVTDTIYAGAGDGYSGGAGSTSAGLSTAWNSSHDLLTGTATDYVATLTLASSEVEYSEINCEPPNTFRYLVSFNRAFFPFDTSTIPSSAVISSATLNTYVTNKGNDDNDGVDYITVVQTSQSTHSSLANADFDQCGAIDNPTEGIDSGERKDITSVSTSAYLTFTLNSTGLGWIKKNGEDAPCSTTNGISCFGLREGHDATDNILASPTAPPECSSTYTSSYVSISTSETTGTSQDPYLSVTYTVPAAEIKRHDVFWFD